MTQKFQGYNAGKSSQGSTNAWQAQSKGASFGKADKFGQINGCTVGPKYASDLMSHEHLLDDEHITGVFLKIDCNHSGKISVAELFLFLTRQGYELNHKKTFAILDKHDCKKDDDQLDLLEFISFFREAFPEKCDNQK